MARNSKRRRPLTTGSASSNPHRVLPYWMRHPRTINANRNSSAAATAVTANMDVHGDSDRETVAGGDDDSVDPSAPASHSHDCGAEPATSSPRMQRMNISDNHCASSRSTRLANSTSTCVKTSDGRKLVSCEASSRLGCSDEHPCTGRASDENVHHHRLHCGDGGECCLCTTNGTECMGALSWPTDCNHCPCLRTASTNAHIDRPWVSAYTMFVLVF